MGKDLIGHDSELAVKPMRVHLEQLVQGKVVGSGGSRPPKSDLQSALAAVCPMRCL